MRRAHRLKGARTGSCSIHVNQQWRIYFKRTAAGTRGCGLATDVLLLPYQPTETTQDHL
jgi:plasmid maintenance system killer protein